jgi:hypothetical protein
MLLMALLMILRSNVSKTGTRSRNGSVDKEFVHQATL